MSSSELRKGFSPKYFSLEDIIASQNHVPCRALVNIKKFGHESQDLAPGWLSIGGSTVGSADNEQKRQPLREPFVSASLPKFFNEKFREVLKADPSVIDLNKMGGPQFYQTGLQLCELPLSSQEADDTDNEIEDLAELLTNVLTKRLIAMMDSYSLQRQEKSTDEIQAKSSSSHSGNALRPNQMDALEAQLFSDAKRSSEQLDKWLNG